MSATLSGLAQVTAPSSRPLPKPSSLAAVPMAAAVAWRWNGGGRQTGMRRRMVAVVRGAPEGLSEKVAESVKEAEEKCADDPASGECVAAWDEVEELSAAASHARDRKKEQSDPLETYCKDNPETEECRTYDN